MLLCLRSLGQRARRRLREGGRCWIFACDTICGVCVKHDDGERSEDVEDVVGVDF